MKSVDPSLGKFFPVTFFYRLGMLLTLLLIKGVPGRKPYLAYDISFGETKGKLLPKNFIPHLIDGFLNEGPGQINLW